MNLLLDTHVALWAITDSARLGALARQQIMAERTTVWVSVVSLWEIATKHALGRGDMPVSAHDAAAYFRDSGFRMLVLYPEHALGVEALPALHNDPFDRMLVAQARVEPMRLLTHDATVASYGGTVVHV